MGLQVAYLSASFVANGTLHLRLHALGPKDSSLLRHTPEGDSKNNSKTDPQARDKRNPKSVMPLPRCPKTEAGFFLGVYGLLRVIRFLLSQKSEDDGESAD